MDGREVNGLCLVCVNDFGLSPQRYVTEAFVSYLYDGKVWNIGNICRNFTVLAADEKLLKVRVKELEMFYQQDSLSFTAAEPPGKVYVTD